MSASDTFGSSLRMERTEASRLARALVFSLLLHVLCFGVYYTGKKMDVWKHIPLPAWTPKLLTQMATLKPPTQPKQPVEQEVPLVFVQVNPAQNTAEPPKNAKYYSDRHSQAANRETDRETNLPKISGEQDRVIKTEDVVPEKFEPLRPAPPVTQAQKGPQEQEETKAAPDLKSGDMQVGKATPSPQPDEGAVKKSKPRTIIAALANKGQTELPGRKMKQDGGVKRRLEINALDAKATPFGAYDSAFIAFVDERWRTLLYDRDYATFTSGKVVLQFRLHYDGRISDMRVAENTAGEVLGLICQKAVMDPAPYPVWPSDLRRMAGDTRSIQFTFYYN